MRRDIRDLPVSTDSDAAAAALDAAVEGALKFRRDTPDHLAAALDADPEFALAHCMRGYMLSLAADPANAPAVARALDAARRGYAALTPREKLHADALEAWSRDAMDEAFAAWGRILEDAPTDLLALRMRDTNWFRHGRTEAIRAQADAVAPAWSPGVPGRDCFLSLRAFAHEETGGYASAEAMVDEAHSADGANFFAHHVKAHILEMDCRPGEGIAWLDANQGPWGLGNALVHHLWWHRALMELDRDGPDALLARYDGEVRNFDDPLTKAAPAFYIDLQNAAALLWRLELAGVDPGARWDELADKAQQRAGQIGHPLLVPHLAMALAAAGRDAALGAFMAALRAAAEAPGAWGGAAAREAVIPVCEAAIAHRRGDHARVVALLLPRREAIRLLGGSNAQRDMFHQMLLDSAVRSGRGDAAATLLAHERATRRAPPEARAGYAAAARAAA